MSSGMLYAGALRANLVERAELWRWSSLGRERSKIEEAAFPILSGWPLPRPADWLEDGQSASERSGTGGSPPVRRPQLFLRRCGLDCQNRHEPGAGTDTSPPRATENEPVITQNTPDCPILVPFTFFPPLFPFHWRAVFPPTDPLTRFSPPPPRDTISKTEPLDTRATLRGSVQRGFIGHRSATTR